jgi:hypothetical protein
MVMIGCNNLGFMTASDNKSGQNLVEAIQRSPEPSGDRRGSWNLGFIHGLFLSNVYPSDKIYTDEATIKIADLSDSSKVTRTKFRAAVEYQVFLFATRNMQSWMSSLMDEELDKIFFQGMLRGMQEARNQVSKPVSLGFCVGWIAKHDGRKSPTKFETHDPYIAVMIKAPQVAGTILTKKEEAEIEDSVSNRKAFEEAASLGFKTREGMNADFAERESSTTGGRGANPGD